MKELDGKVAVVTGAGSGIGRALSLRLASEGMRVVAADVEKTALDETAQLLEGMGAQFATRVTDVTRAGDVQDLADETVDRFRAVHLVCNNAGVGGGGSTWDAPLETWEWVLGVNLWGVIHGVRSFVPLLLQQPEAHLVNTASVAGVTAAPFMGPYNASKHAVVAISETLHHELALSGANVKVSVLCPGWVNTRIAESARNRPEHLQVEESPGDDALLQVLQSHLDTGMAPDEVAGKVVDAVKAERFWVLTHDDAADMWVKAVAERCNSLLERRNPRFEMQL